MRHGGTERVAAAETVRVRYCMQRWEKDHVTTNDLSDSEKIEYDHPKLFGNESLDYYIKLNHIE